MSTPYPQPMGQPVRALPEYGPGWGQPPGLPAPTQAFAMPPEWAGRAVRYQPPAPGRLAPAGPALSDSEDTAAWIRYAVIDRLVRLSHNHARLTWNGDGGPVCPHALAFLYLDREATGALIPETAVVAATLAVPDTEDVRALPDLLFRLVGLAERYRGQGGFDPGVQLSIYRDRASGRAAFVGVGISTLDTEAEPWEKVRRRAEDLQDVGGRMLALLLDGTAVLVDRGAPRQVRGDMVVHTTRDLAVDGAYRRAPRGWERHMDVLTMPDPAPQHARRAPGPAGNPARWTAPEQKREVWDLMHQLNTLVWQQDPRPTL